jgi:short-subunit dehydrogenase
MGSMNMGDKEEIASMFEKIAMTTPETAARTILKGVRKNRRRVLVGGDAIMLDTTQRLMPTGYQRLLEVMFKKQKSGKNEKTNQGMA